MHEQNKKSLTISEERINRKAVSRWENEGGATVTGNEKHPLIGKIITHLRRMKMRIVNYNEKNKNSGNTETHIATDEAMEKKFGNIQNAYEEGFASADGVRGGTAETDGRITHPEKGDNSIPKRTPNFIENENSGLADN